MQLLNCFGAEHYHFVVVLQNNASLFERLPNFWRDYFADDGKLVVSCFENIAGTICGTGAARIAKPTSNFHYYTSGSKENSFFIIAFVNVCSALATKR
jgi:hypothetical protein